MQGHDQAIARLRAAAGRISLREASDAFLASLSTRNLTWRGVLQARVMAQHLPDHDYVRQTRYSHGDQCAVCGFCDLGEEYGVSPGWLATRIEDLGVERPEPTQADIATFNAILIEVARQKRLSIDGRVRRAELSKSLSKVFKSNKYERMTLLDALGRCSVLAPPGGGFLRTFVRHDDRRQGTGNNDFEYPFALWEASMGFDQQAVSELFPQDGIDTAVEIRPAPLDEPTARKELEQRSAAARGEDTVAEVLYAPGGLWIARLTDGTYAIFLKLGRRWRWITGERDNVLASVPEVLFEEAVQAVLEGS